MDQMQVYEVEDILKNLGETDVNSWEQTRFITYCIAQANSKKKLKPSDVMKFSWDKTINRTGETSISKEDIERLKQKAEQYLNTK